MSTHADYTPDEWNVLVHAPVQASMMIINADKTGGITGQFGIIQETKDARKAIESHAANDTGLVHEVAQALLDEASWKPIVANATPETVTTALSRAGEIVTTKAPADEALAYKRYVDDIARKTASAAKESGPSQTSPKEAVAIQQITSLLHLDS